MMGTVRLPARSRHIRLSPSPAMSAAPAITTPGPMSLEEYLRLEETSELRHEDDRGHVRAMAGGTPDHSLLKVAVVTVLRNALEGRCLVFDSDMRVHVSEAKRSYPDAAVVCGEPEYPETNSLGNPTVVVEVLSPSTATNDRMNATNDRMKKMPEYLAMPSVRAVLLVHSEVSGVEVFSRDDEGTISFDSASDRNAWVRIPPLDLTLSLAELYRDTPDITEPREPSDAELLAQLRGDASE